MSGSPNYTYRPVFTASNVPCALLVVNETKSRLIAGGMFFRSRETGEITNHIYLTGRIELVGAQSLYVLSIVKRNPTNNDVLARETFTERYIAGTPPTPNPMPPPATLPGIPSPTIDLLRNKVNASSQLIEIPKPNNDIIFQGQEEGITLDPFGPNIRMRGATGAPVPPSSTFIGIRTGPERTLSFISLRDIGHAFVEVNQTIEWNGTFWQNYQRYSN
jgi:hypothetical protein